MREEKEQRELESGAREAAGKRLEEEEKGLEEEEDKEGDTDDDNDSDHVDQDVIRNVSDKC